MATLRRARLRLSRTIEADVAGAVRLYRTNGSRLMQTTNEAAVGERTAMQHRIELALTLVGLTDLVELMRQERDIVTKIYKRKRAHLDYSSLLARRESLRRRIDGRAAEADIELAT